MKTKTLTGKRFLLPLAAIGLVIGLASWGNNNGGNNYHFYQQGQPADTPLPKKVKKEKSIRDLDEALEELDRVDIDKEMEMAQREIRSALEGIDMKKIEEEVHQALKNIDMKAIQQQVDAALKEVDAKKIQEEVQQALKNVDMEAIQKEIQESMAKINTDKIREELDRAKNIDLTQVEASMEKAKEQMKNLKPQIEKELQQAKGQIEKARAKIQEYKAFVDGLAADGLLDKKGAYTIEQKDGDLYINGKKTSAETRAKYSRFLDQHKNLKITRTDDDFNVNMQDSED